MSQLTPYALPCVAPSHASISIDIVYTHVYTSSEVIKLLSSKVFKSGNSQAIRLPKEYRLEEEELYIQKVGNALILFPKQNPWEAFERSLGEFSDDFMAEGRNQPKAQERENL